MTEKKNHKHKSENNQLDVIPWRMYLIIYVVGFIIIGMLGYGSFKGNRLIKVYAPLVDASMEIKLEATTAHLWFEEFISGDLSVDINEVWKHQDLAEWYAKAMVEGGKNPEGTFIPLDDAGMRRSIEDVLVKIKEFRNIAQSRLDTKELSDIGTDIEQQYDHVFNSFLKETDDVETRLQQIMAKDLGRFRYTQMFLLVISILLFLAIGMSFWYFDNQRVKSLLLVNKMNKSLQVSEENLSITLHSIGDAVIATDIDGKITRMNPVAEELTGWKLLDAKGRPIEEVFNIINEQTRKKVQSPVERVIQEGVIVGLANHTALISTSGVEYSIADSGAPIRNAQDEIIGVVLVFRDVTKQYKAEVALRESEEKYREFVEETDDLITSVDQDGIFLFVNHTSDKVFGLSPQNCVGLSAFDFIHPDDRERTQKWFYEISVTKQISGMIENRQINKNGQVYHMLWTSNFHYDKDGNINGVNSIGRDITEQRRMEAHLLQAQKMESIGVLAGGIAHDFNNILSPIMIHAEMAMMDMPENSPVQNNLKRIFHAGERARDLVKQILTFARKREGEKIPIEISRIVKDVITLLRASIPTTIDIQYDIDNEYDTVLADPIQLQQIIMNLCTNAAHAMDEKGGMLKVVLKNENLDPKSADVFSDIEPGRYVKLIVKDTGKGIEPEILDKIFEPYFTTKDVDKGTGMGLALVHSIVQNYGGAITVESEINKGTTFHVYLPFFEEESYGTEKREDPKHLFTGSERILFVDDEKETVESIQQTLSLLGYKVTARTSAIEALEAFQNNPQEFDLVITDMTMPKMTGVELARQIMATRVDIPIILCTGFSEKIDEKRAKEIGIRAFVMKPFVMHDIANKIREVLDQKKLT